MKNKKFSVKLKTIMTLREISSKSLAKKLNVSTPTVNSWRQGNPPKKYDTLRKLSTVLNIPFESLFEENLPHDSTMLQNQSHESLILQPHSSSKQKSIHNYFLLIFKSAEKNNSLEHLYLELIRHFPLDLYDKISISSNLAKKSNLIK